MKKLVFLLAAIVFFGTAGSEASARTTVLASIKPLHSLVAAVMEGAGKPGLIVDGAGSPHAYSLKPSQAAEMEEAILIFWIGPQLEAFLEKPLETIAASANSVALMEAPGLTALEPREGGAFDGHDDHERDAHGHIDPHVWLDPQNAKVFVRQVAKALIAADPANASLYEANASKVSNRLDRLLAEVENTLGPVKGRPFIVFHDAFHYFENRFGIAAAGSIMVTPDIMPGAERMREIRGLIVELGAVCVFAEPQFAPKLIPVAIEGTGAKTGVLDPLGASLKNGPDLYFELIRALAGSIRECLE